MARSRQRRKPSFLWQALLILLPVAILAAVGFLSLRQDKIIAQHDAVARAQTIADNLLPRLWSVLTNADKAEAFEHHAFQVDSEGNLLFPPAVSATPALRPLNPSELTAKQLALWQQAEQAEVTDANIPAGTESIRAFLAEKPPDRFAAIANYNLGVLLMKENQWQAAANTFVSLLDKYPDKTAESGLPLDRLAEFKLLELSIIMTNPPPAKVLISADNFCRRIIFDPSPLTSSFLSWVSAHAEALDLKDGNDYWSHLWQEYEQSRQLYRNARANLKVDESASNPGQGATIRQIFWFNNAGENCLAVRFDELPVSEQSRYGNAFPRHSRILTTSQSASRIKGKMDLQPEPGKNWLTSPNLSHNEPPGFRAPPSGSSHYGGGVPQRNVMSSEFSNVALATNQTRRGEAVTLDNEPARIESSRAKPILNVSGGTARKNGTSSIEFSGPANEQPGAASNPWFLCRSESEISQQLARLLDDKEQIPEYFGVGIEIAGKLLRESAPDLRVWRGIGFFEGSSRNRKIYLTETATNILASALLSGARIPQLRMNVYLTSPSTLFKRQSDRTFWFGSLVSIATLAAFIGLVSAWRAFNRQQELTEMKTNFVSSVSHELRAPIASVRLMAESLERGKIADPPRQHEYFRFIGQECRRLSSLIENVLDFSRIEQGRKQYEFEPTDILALVQQTVALMQPYAAERQITLTFDNLQPSTYNLELSVDARAIQQAIINLLDNAIKHSPDGQTVSVTLECSADTTHSDHESPIHISVQDHGPGIPPEEQEKIFERFYRLGTELRRETQGVGIGLSIVKHIVEAHHGRVLVQSAPGQGSRFTIELPMPGAQDHSVQ